MSLQLIVTLRVPTQGANGEKRSEWHGAIGTGYSVHPSYGLTARHVVRPERRDPDFPIKVRWYDCCDREDPKPGWIDLDYDLIAWEGDEVLDVALVRCARIDRLRQIVGFPLASGLPAAKREWTRRGFPRATNIEKLRLHGDILGEVCESTPNDPAFGLISRLQTDTEDDWSGASGMPVLVDGQIIGVIKDVAHHFKAQIIQREPAAPCPLGPAEPSQKATADSNRVRIVIKTPKRPGKKKPSCPMLCPVRCAYRD